MKNKIKQILDYDKYIYSKYSDKKLKTTIFASLLIAGAFLVLSIVNAVSNSILMLYLTAAGALLEIIGVVIGYFTKKYIYPCAFSIVTNLILFTFFAIIGGNEGFAILWIVLFPCISIAMCDLRSSFWGAVYLLLFCTISFWTPLHTYFYYEYSSTFALRFPILYIVSFVLSIYLAITIKKSQYDAIKHEEQLDYIKDYDKMTGVYNRTKYEEMLENELNTYETVGVGFFDVNYLKYINDNYGHKKGDYIVMQIANILKECNTIPHYIFRYGGDEFIVVIPNCTQDDCTNFINDWKNYIEEKQKLEPNIIYSIAYGMTFGTKGYDIKKLISQADKKMYKLKKYMHNHKI